MSTCMKCGTEAKGQAKYCKTCGAQLKGGALLDKKARVMAEEKRWVKPVVLAAAVTAVIAAVWIGKGMLQTYRMGDHPVLAPVRDASATTTNAALVEAGNGVVRIPAASVSDGQAHFFSYAAGGKTIRFFVMKAGDGSFRTALDACMACNEAKLGYRQERGMVVCNNCGMAFRPADIGKVSGGCNPIPIAGTTDGQTIVVKTGELEAGTKYF